MRSLRLTWRALTGIVLAGTLTGVGALGGVSLAAAHYGPSSEHHKKWPEPAPAGLLTSHSPGRCAEGTGWPASRGWRMLTRDCAERGNGWRVPGPAGQQRQAFGTTVVNHRSCAPSAILVNPCRPWFGAAVGGNPGAPASHLAQFDYLEHLIGHPLDIYRDYDSYQGARGRLSRQPLTSTEAYFARHPGTYVDVNWNPSRTWRQALPASQGGSSAVNADIAAVANSIKKMAPHKIFLSLWHETNLAVSGGTTCPAGGQHAGAGTPAQYVAAYQHIWHVFRAAGVTNVIWVMDYSSYAKRTCLVPQLWPGNSYVDWVIYDTYSRGKTWDQTAGRFYKLLEKDNSPRFNVDPKPWGIGEFGTCKQPPGGISPDQYYQSVAQAIKHNTYPRLKMYMIYADTGNNAGQECLTNYSSGAHSDIAKQSAFNQIARTIFGMR